MPSYYGRKKRIYKEDFSDDDSDDTQLNHSSLQPLQLDGSTNITINFSPKRLHTTKHNTDELLQSPKRTQRVIDVFSSSPSRHSISTKSESTPPTSPIYDLRAIEGKQKEQKHTSYSTHSSTHTTPTKKETKAWDNLFESMETKSPSSKSTSLGQLSPGPQSPTKVCINVDALVQSMAIPVEYKAKAPKLSDIFPLTKQVEVSKSPQPIRKYGATRSYLAEKELDFATEHSQMISDTHDYNNVAILSKADTDIRLLGVNQLHRDETKEILDGLIIRPGLPIEASNQMLMESLVGLSRTINTRNCVPDQRILSRLQNLTVKLCQHDSAGSLILQQLIAAVYYYIAKVHHAGHVNHPHQLLTAAKNPIEISSLMVLQIARTALQEFLDELPTQQEIVECLCYQHSYIT